MTGSRRAHLVPSAPRRIYEQADGFIVPLERLHEFLIAQGWYLPRQTLRWMGDRPQAYAAVEWVESQNEP